MQPTNLKIAVATAAAIALPLIAASEGFVDHVYRDPVGIPTYCFGETSKPEWGKKYSMTECRGILNERVARAALDVLKCIHAPMKDHELAALASFAYNVGTTRFCGSTLAKRADEGQLPTACAELSKWVYAGGRQLPGLVTRRAKERAMCEGRP